MQKRDPTHVAIRQIPIVIPTFPNSLQTSTVVAHLLRSSTVASLASGMRQGGRALPTTFTIHGCSGGPAAAMLAMQFPARKRVEGKEQKLFFAARLSPGAGWVHLEFRNFGRIQIRGDADGERFDTHPRKQPTAPIDSRGCFFCGTDKVRTTASQERRAFSLRTQSKLRACRLMRGGENGISNSKDTVEGVQVLARRFARRLLPAPRRLLGC